MTLYKGFVYSKLHSLGTRTEGPHYFLQVYPPSNEYRMIFKPVEGWQDDEELHKFLGKRVKVEVDLLKRNPPYLQVKTIEEIGIDWKD